MPRALSAILIFLLATTGIYAADFRPLADSYSIDINVEAKPVPVDSVHVAKDAIDLRDAIRKRGISYADTAVRYPAFIEFCIKAYRWFDRTFNSYDPEYVAPTGKRGKVRLVCDSWFDGFWFRPRSHRSMTMTGDIFTNVGVSANYSIISLGYSVDVNSFITGKPAKHKKLDFSFAWSRLFFDAQYWQNKAGTNIRKFGDIMRPDGSALNEHFDGLDFEAYSVSALYIFNYNKFSYSAGYSLSNYQIKSAGSFMLGAIGSFYDAEFDFKQLPPAVKDQVNYPFDEYRLHYNSVGVMGGYSYNWVCNKHFLFNVTALPSVGISFTFDNSSDGNRRLLSLSLKQLMSLTYFNKNFFITINSNFLGNFFHTSDIGFIATIGNIQLSSGIRF